jgi:hypothetical protein
MNTTKTWNREDCKGGALKATESELLAMGITEKDIIAGEKRGKLVTYGPWQLPVSYKAVCTSSLWDKTSGFPVPAQVAVYGIRTLTNVRQDGYELEGRVSIGGKKYSAFTSSQLFELPDGRLIDVATIHARIR